MLTFILVAAGIIFVVFAIVLAYGANQRKRAGQSGKAEANGQHTGQPQIRRSPGVD